VLHEGNNRPWFREVFSHLAPVLPGNPGYKDNEVGAVRIAKKGLQAVGLKPVIALSPAPAVSFMPRLLISGGRDVAATAVRLSREQLRDIQE